MDESDDKEQGDLEAHVQSGCLIFSIRKLVNRVRTQLTAILTLTVGK